MNSAAFGLAGAERAVELLFVRTVTRAWFWGGFGVVFALTQVSLTRVVSGAFAGGMCLGDLSIGLCRLQLLCISSYCGAVLESTAKIPFGIPSPVRHQP